MNEKLSNLLRIMIVGMALCGIVIYLFAFPYIGKSLVGMYPEFENRFWPWLIFLWMTGIPCYIVLVQIWKVTDTIKKDKVFVSENVKRISLISKLALFDSTFFLLGNIVLLLLSMNHPSIVILSLGISFIGYSISIVSYAFANFVNKAVVLQEESDLTI